MANTRKKVRKEGTRERVPFGGLRLKLKVPDGLIPEGYVGRWINDTESRLEEAQSGGWEFVLKRDNTDRLGEGQIHQDNTSIDSRISKIVSKGQNTPVRAYLMKIKKAWFDQDQKAKEERNRMVDEAILRGQAGGAAIENQYTPKGGGVTLQRP